MSCSNIATILAAENTFWYELPPQKSDTAAQNAVIELPRTDTEKGSVKKKKTEKIPLHGQFQVKGFFTFYYFYYSLCTPYGAGDSATIDAGLVGIIVYVTGKDGGTIGFSPVDLISSLPRTASIHSARATFSFNGFPE